jgi:hypothetical protein
MRKFKAVLVITLLSQLILSCTKMEDSTSRTDGEFSRSDFSSEGSIGPGGNGGDTAGVITAGEWNDLNNWSLWNRLLQKDTIKAFPGIWGFYHQNKVTVIVKDAGNKLLHDAKVNLTYNGNTTSARTGNDGKAELFASIYQPAFTLNDFRLSVEYMGRDFDLGSFSSSRSVIVKNIPVTKSVNNILDIMFAVDATGSMGDEISYLKNELRDVVSRAGGQLPGNTDQDGKRFLS